MGLGLGLGIWWPTQTSIIPGLLKALCARATYCENKLCTTATLEEIAAVRYTAPVLPIGLLADYPGAAAAYSLRNLIDTATSVVRVRRSNDNTEQDFTATEITDGTLTTFTGANDGFVTTWYDQSGNSVNAAQTTATRQPQIVDSGVAILENGKPTLKYNGLNQLYTNNFTVEDQPNSYFMAFKLIPQTNTNIFDGSTDRNAFYHYQDNYRMWSGADAITSFTTTGQMSLSYSLFYGSNGALAINGDIQTGLNTGPQGMSQLRIGSYTGGGSLNGSISEFIMYPTDQSANRTGIETNINTEYTIY
jgi:hypothetical protein